MVAAKDWPTHLDFRDALGNTAVCFDDADLKGGKIPTNALGFLRASTGGFASVYQVEKAGRRWAVRCFTSPLHSDVAQRYSAISQHLVMTPLPYMVQFAYDERGVRVEGQLYPTVKMAWIDGESLSKYVAGLVARKDAAGLTALLGRWHRLCNDLVTARVAHGDLQHGNVIVTPSTELRLVDYDGMFVPALLGRQATELGQPAYQHPLRTKAQFGLELDRYSALVIYTAIAALVSAPGLWSRYDNEDNLLFTPDDHLDPANSSLFRELIALPRPACLLAAELAAAAIGPLRAVPTIDKALTRATAPALPAAGRRAAPAVSGSAPWWKQAALAESGVLVAQPVDHLGAARPVWSRPGIVVVHWTEQEPIFAKVVKTVTVTKRPARRFFKKTDVPIHRTEQVQTGSRSIAKQRVDQVGTNLPGLKDIAVTGGLAYGLAAGSIIRWKLDSADVQPVSISVPEMTEGIAAADGLFAVASREKITLMRGNSVTQSIRREGNSLFYAVAVSPKATRVAAGLGQKAAVVYDAATGKRVRRLEGFRRKVQAVAFLGEDKVLVGSDDSTVALFDVGGRRLATAHDHMLEVVSVATSLAGDLAASADSLGQIHIYSAPDLRNRFTVNLRDEVRSMAFAPSGHFLVAASAEGPIAVINTHTGRVDATLRTNGTSTHLCSGVSFTDSGDLVTSHDNGLILLWSTDPQRLAVDFSKIQLKHVSAYGARPTATSPTVAGHVPSCPNCGRGMVVRRRNTAPYTRFWGCPSFPGCKGTRNL